MNELTESLREAGYEGHQPAGDVLLSLKQSKVAWKTVQGEAGWTVRSLSEQVHGSSASEALGKLRLLFWKNHSELRPKLVKRAQGVLT